MMRLLKFLLTYKLKNSQFSDKNGGFTLIELLVGLVLAFLIITPLLGFMINILDTDRKEQAKASSEQEIQAALDYIARDLDQSFFIYDAFGLSKIKDQLPKVQNAEGEPVLVFWKRKFLPKSLPIKGQNINNCKNDPNTKNCNDAFVYSLVGYYLIKDTNCAATWSCTTRIGRVELNDTLFDVNNNQTQPVSDDYKATPGLVPIADLLKQTGSIEQQLNDWSKVTLSSYDYTKTQFQILIDYVDQSTGANVPKPDCSIATRPEGSARPDEQTYPNNYLYRQVPVYSTSPVPTGAVDAKFETGSFYACVDTDKTLAQVFIRGNALARTSSKSNPPKYVDKSAYFPSANIQAKGRGLLSEKPQ